MALVVKNLPANAGDRRDASSIPGSGRSPGGGHGNSLQYSCLENPTDRGAWQATVHGVAELDMTEATLYTQNYVNLQCDIYILNLPALWASRPCNDPRNGPLISQGLARPQMIPNLQRVRG